MIKILQLLSNVIQIKERYLPFTCFRFTIRLGYGINGMDRVVTNNELCSNKNSDNFEKYQEAVFQMDIKATHDIKANQWALYSDLDAEKSGFVCEKEGS